MKETASTARQISDVCLLVEDLERATRFYRDVVGFALRRQAPGFADFFTGGATLALWELKHMTSHLKLTEKKQTGWRMMAAMQLESAAQVDETHRELSGRGVAFLTEPRVYGWNAYAAYFSDPEENLWEIYCWQEGGHRGLIFDGESAE